MKRFDINKDNQFTKAEIQAVTKIEYDGYFKEEHEKIKSLEGIEYFTSLMELNCRGNMLESLDVTKNKKLEMLNCSHNQLESLDVTENTLLEQLYCQDNHLKNLIVKNNEFLSCLNCTNNNLTGIELPGKIEITLFADFNNKAMRCIIPAAGIKGVIMDLNWNEVITNKMLLTGGKVDHTGKIVFDEGSDTISFNYNGYQHQLIKEGKR